MRATQRPVLFCLQLLLAACLSGPLLAQAAMVRLYTVLGPVDIALYDAVAPAGAPATVANFLGYVRKGAYNNSFIHRSLPGFVVQGGGFTWDDVQGNYATVLAGPAVVNEFSALRSNVRATVAMAKLGSDPNSATTEWFFNVANNASNLDNQNGGFTVFGKVTTPGMLVVDAMAALTTINGNPASGGAFANLPLVKPVVGSYKRENFVMINSASLLPTATDADRAFNYLEAVYADYLKPVGGETSFTASAYGRSYYYRYYPSSNSYVGVADGFVDYLVPVVSNQVQRFAKLADVLPAVTQAGY